MARTQALARTQPVAPRRGVDCDSRRWYPEVRRGRRDSCMRKQHHGGLLCSPRRLESYRLTLQKWCSSPQVGGARRPPQSSAAENGGLGCRNSQAHEFTRESDPGQSCSTVTDTAQTFAILTSCNDIRQLLNTSNPQVPRRFRIILCSYSIVHTPILSHPPPRSAQAHSPRVRRDP